MIRSVAIVAEQWCRTPAGGVGVYAEQLTQALARQPSLRIRTISSDRIGRVDLPNVSHVRLGTPHRATVELLSRSVTPPGWRRAVDGSDVIHTTSFDLPPGNDLYSVFVHDTLWRNWPNAYSERGRRWHEHALQRVVRSSATVLVPSQAVCDAVREAGIAADRVVVTGEGSDHLPLPTGTRPAPAGAAPFFLSVATAQPRKNLAKLVEAFRQFKQSSGMDHRLLLIGPSGWGEVAIARVPDVEFVGAVSTQTLSDLYDHAEGLLCVSLAEGLGLPVLEAFRAGTPVLASYGVPAAAEHPDSALLVHADSLEEIAQGMVQLAQDSSATQHRVACARRVAGEHTWSVVARRHLDAWAARQ
jgi:glycosyltransferase involved in cell wall biosynthesis